MTMFLIVAGALLLGGVIGALLIWRRYNNELSTARTERRAAQYELAEQIAGFDRYVEARDEQREKDDAEYKALYDHAEKLNAEADQWWEAYVKADNKRNELLELIRERGMHDAAAAAAHEAEVVDEEKEARENPLWAELTGLRPLPLPTGHTQEIRRDLIQRALDVERFPDEVRDATELSYETGRHARRWPTFDPAEVRAAVDEARERVLAR